MVARQEASTRGTTLVGNKKSMKILNYSLLLPLVVACGINATVAVAQDSCERVNAYWNTNLDRLNENLNDCGLQTWQKCSQAAAIHYDLNFGSLGQRAEACGFQMPEVPGGDFTRAEANDGTQCLTARDELRRVFEIRALARLSCAAARIGGDNQEWLDAQCTKHRSQMVNYHYPFRKVVQQCEIDYNPLIASLNPNLLLKEQTILSGRDD